MPDVDYGWRPSPGGPTAPSGSLPEPGRDAIELATLELHRRPRIRNQGQVVPCCVSIAVTGAFELLLARGGRLPELSPMFHYYRARSDPNTLLSLSLLDATHSAGELCFWSLERRTELRRIRLRGISPRSLAVSDDGSQLFIGSSQGKIEWWTLQP